MPLTDGGKIAGATTAILTVSNAAGAEAGNYWLVLSNGWGCVTSAVATLTVLEPLFTAQPVASTNVAGSTASFSATAVGSVPMVCEWWKDSVQLTVHTNWSSPATVSLVLNNVTGVDAGNYWLVITNVYGRATSAVARLCVVDPVITSQPTNQSGVLGGAAQFSVSAIGTQPLQFQWWKDGVPLDEATNSTLHLVNLAATDAGYYRVTVSNIYGSVTSTVAALTVNVVMVTPEFSQQLNGPVYSFIQQRDGKIMIGGAFSAVGSVPKARVARLNQDGSLDSWFDAEANATVYCLAQQPDGRMLIGGAFTVLNEFVCPYLGRLNPDGSLDLSFTPQPDNVVRRIAVEPDGKVIIGGRFSSVNGQSMARICRLRPDATIDSSFNASANGDVNCVVVQPDGKILVGGSFGVLSGQSCANLGRLNPDGTLDPTFNAGTYGAVCAMALQPDGKIVVGGSFWVLCGQNRAALGRLNPDGSLDSTFTAEANGTVYTLGLQCDGKILVGGEFTMLGGATCTRVGRLNPDGTPDLNFAPRVDGSVYAAALQADGKILIGGAFSTVDGHALSNIACLDNTDQATEYLTCDVATITWHRTGAAPEINLAVFEATTNGVDWTALGPCTQLGAAGNAQA